MRRAFIRLLLFALSISIWCVSVTTAEGNWGTVSLNAGEITAHVLAQFLGDGYLISLDKLTSDDEIDSRFIIIGNNKLGSDLVIIVRTSESEVYYWPLELSKDNLLKAKLVLDKDAPLCSVSLYQNDKLKNSAIYEKKFNLFFSYEEFAENVNEIFNSISAGSGSNGDDISDPIISLFPGIEWGMTQTELFSRYGKDTFSAFPIQESAMMTQQNVLGDNAFISFSFRNGKLKMIVTMGENSRIDTYIQAYTHIYGEPKRVSYIGTILGDLDEDPDGDCYAWINGKTVILISDTLHEVEYKPLY